MKIRIREGKSAFTRSPMRESSTVKDNRKKAITEVKEAVSKFKREESGRKKARKKVVEIIERLGRKRISNRQILKKDKTIVEIREHKPVKDVSRYFKEEFEETKRSLFLK